MLLVVPGRLGRCGLFLGKSSTLYVGGRRLFLSKYIHGTINKIRL